MEDLRQGVAVDANFKGKGRWCPGKVAKDWGNNSYDIQYDDGDFEESVPLNRLRVLKEGSLVEANYAGKGKFYSGKVSKDRGDGTYDIAYDDGENEERVKRINIRVTGKAETAVATPKDTPALPTSASAASVGSAFKVGTVVDANYQGEGKWFPGKISRDRGNATYDISYDDGDSEESVPPDRIRPLVEGTSVQANYAGKGKYYPGKMTKDRGDGTFDIAYDDGESESRVKRDRIRVVGSKPSISVTTAASAPTPVPAAAASGYVIDAMGNLSPRKGGDDSSSNAAVSIASAVAGSGSGNPFELKVGSIVDVNYEGQGTWFSAKVVKDLGNGSYNILFDDGDKEDNVPLTRIRILASGSLIEANYKDSGQWYPGKVTAVKGGGQYDVEYDDGDSEKSVPRSRIKVLQRSKPPVAVGAAAAAVAASDSAKSSAANSTSNGSSNVLKQGSIVDVNHKGKGKWRPGRVMKDWGNEKYDIQYDEGDMEENVSLNRIRILCDGSTVEANYAGKGKYYSGRVTKDRGDGTYDVAYDDGEREDRVKRDRIRILEQSKPPVAASSAAAAAAAASSTSSTAATAAPAATAKATEQAAPIAAAAAATDAPPGPTLARRDSANSAKSQSANTAAILSAILKPGSVVDANFKGKGKWCPGKIAKDWGNQTYDIHYDDGDFEENVSLNRVRALVEGALVEANYAGKGKYYSGRVTKDRGDGTYDVAYDDGESEDRVKRDRIRLLDGFAKGVTVASFDKRGQGQNPTAAATISSPRGERRSSVEKAALEAEATPRTGSLDDADDFPPRKPSLGMSVSNSSVVSQLMSISPADSSEEPSIMDKSIAEKAAAALKGLTPTESLPSATMSPLLTSNKAIFTKPVKGSIVDANFKGKGRWCPGKVIKDWGNDTYDILYDDGDFEESVPQNRVVVLAEGTAVEVNFSEQGEFLPGKLTKCHENGTFDVQYDSGSVENGVKRPLIRVAESARPKSSLLAKARSTSSPMLKKKSESFSDFKSSPSSSFSKAAASAIAATSSSSSSAAAAAAAAAAPQKIAEEKSAGEEKGSDKAADKSGDDNAVSPSGLEPGLSVDANYQGKGKWFPGKIARDRGGDRYDVTFDDGDKEENVPLSCIKVLTVDTPVEANYKSKGKYYPGKIGRDHGDGSFAVLYDDGEKEEKVLRRNIRISDKVKKPDASAASAPADPMQDKVLAEFLTPAKVPPPMNIPGSVQFTGFNAMGAASPFASAASPFPVAASPFPTSAASPFPASSAFPSTSLFPSSSANPTVPPFAQGASAPLVGGVAPAVAASPFPASSAFDAAAVLGPATNTAATASAPIPAAGVTAAVPASPFPTSSAFPAASPFPVSSAFPAASPFPAPTFPLTGASATPALPFGTTTSAVSASPFPTSSAFPPSTAFPSSSPFPAPSITTNAATGASAQPPASPAATPAKSAGAFVAMTGPVKVGDYVDANFKMKGQWLPGKIKKDWEDGTYDIVYDDGEKETWVPRNLIRLLAEGVPIEANYRSKGRFYPGSILKCNEDGTFDVRYDDGDTESKMLRRNVRVAENVSKLAAGGMGMAPTQSSSANASSAAAAAAAAAVLGAPAGVNPAIPPSPFTPAASTIPNPFNPTFNAAIPASPFPAPFTAAASLFPAATPLSSAVPPSPFPVPSIPQTPLGAPSFSFEAAAAAAKAASAAFAAAAEPPAPALKEAQAPTHTEAQAALSSMSPARSMLEAPSPARRSSVIMMPTTLQFSECAKILRDALRKEGDEANGKALVKRIYKRLDADGDGHLTTSELRMFLLSPELALFPESGSLMTEGGDVLDCNRLLDMLTEEIDFNRDGKVTLAELEAFIFPDTNFTPEEERARRRAHKGRSQPMEIVDILIRVRKTIIDMVGLACARGPEEDLLEAVAKLCKSNLKNRISLDTKAFGKWLLTLQIEEVGMLSPDEADRIVKMSLDGNSDGVISAKEFKKWLFPTQSKGNEALRALKKLVDVKYNGDVSKLFTGLDSDDNPIMYLFKDQFINTLKIEGLQMSSEEFNELTLRVTSADKKITPASILDAFSGEFVAEPHPSALRRSSISFSFDQGERSLSRRNSARDGLVLSPSVDAEDGADPFGKMDIYGARKSSIEPTTPSSTSDAVPAGSVSASGAIDRRLTIPVFSVTEGYTWKPNQIYASASTPLKKSRDQHLGGGAAGFEERQLQENGFFGHVGMWRGWPYDCWTCCNSNARSCKVAAAAAAAKEKKTPAKSRSVTPGKSAKKSLDESGVLSAFGSREAFPVEEKKTKKKKAVKDNKADRQSEPLPRSQSPPKSLSSKAKSTLVFIKSSSAEKSESQLQSPSVTSLASPASNSSRATRMRSRRGAVGTATTSSSVEKSEGELAALSALSALSTESGEEQVALSPPSAAKQRKASKSKSASPLSEDFLNLDSAAEDEGGTISVSGSSEKKRVKTSSSTDHESVLEAVASGKSSKSTKAKSAKPVDVVGKATVDSIANSKTKKPTKKNGSAGKSDADTDAEAASFKSMSLAGIKDTVSRGSKVAAIIVELKLPDLPTLAVVDDEEADFAKEMKLRSAGVVAAKWARMLKKKWLPAKIYLVNYGDGARAKKRNVGAKSSPAALALLVAEEGGKASPAVMGFVLQQKETLRIVCDETDWINEGLVELKKQQLAQQAATSISSAPASSANISNKTPKSAAPRSRSVSTSRSVGASSGKVIATSGRTAGGSVERKTSADAPSTMRSMPLYSSKSAKKMPATSAVSPKMTIPTSRSASRNHRSSSALDNGDGDVDLNASMFLSQEMKSSTVYAGAMGEVLKTVRAEAERKESSYTKAINHLARKVGEVSTESRRREKYLELGLKRQERTISTLHEALVDTQKEEARRVFRYVRVQRQREKEEAARKKNQERRRASSAMPWAQGPNSAAANSITSSIIRRPSRDAPVVWDAEDDEADRMYSDSEDKMHRPSTAEARNALEMSGISDLSAVSGFRSRSRSHSRGRLGSPSRHSVASLSRTGEAERRGRSTLLDSMGLGEEELKEKWLHERARPDCKPVTNHFGRYWVDSNKDGAGHGHGPSVGFWRSNNIGKQSARKDPLITGARPLWQPTSPSAVKRRERRSDEVEADRDAEWDREVTELIEHMSPTRMHRNAYDGGSGHPPSHIDAIESDIEDLVDDLNRAELTHEATASAAAAAPGPSMSVEVSRKSRKDSDDREKRRREKKREKKEKLKEKNRSIVKTAEELEAEREKWWASILQKKKAAEDRGFTLAAAAGAVVR